MKYGSLPASRTDCSRRAGPLAFSSSASSSDCSKETDAAQWMTMSMPLPTSRPSRPRSPLIGLHAAAVEALAGTAVEDLVLEALLRVAAQQQRDLRVRQLPQDLAEHGFSEESRGPGEQDGLAGELLLDEDVVRQSEHRTSRLY